MLTLYTANGTASFPTDPTNYPSLVALALQPSGEQIFADKLDGLQTVSDIVWVPTAYPMATYPMGASVDAGVQALGNNIAGSLLGTPKALAGYSQGAIVTSTIWRDHILNPKGQLHAYLPDFVAGVTWGNPMRAPNVCNGNDYAGWGHQTGGGISGANDLLPDQTPDWWLDFANPNDLYTDSPVQTNGTSIILNDTAKDEALIYGLIVSENFGGTLEGLLKLVVSAVEQLLNPLGFVIGLATSIWNGLSFLAAGPGAGHWTYDPTPAIGYLAGVAAAQHA